MRWRVFKLPDGFNREAYFPGAIQESIRLEQVINAALLSVKEYFHHYPTLSHLQHFHETPFDTPMESLIEDVTRTIFTQYDDQTAFRQLYADLSKQVAECYDVLKENFYFSVLHSGHFGGINDVAYFDTYITWVDPTNFLLLEYPTTMSLSGVEMTYPWFKDYSLLGM